MTTPTFVSLFSGVGGLDLALEYHGWRCAGQVENDPYCIGVLTSHWPDVPRWTDIREVDWDGVAARTGPVDLVAAGFPCQPTSQAGRRKAQEDPRWLWPEVARCLRAVRPDYAFLENTLGLLSRGFDDVLWDLAALGFAAEWDCFQAADVGAPHERDRVFVLAYAAGSRRPPGSSGTGGQVRDDGQAAGWNGLGGLGDRVADPLGIQPERERDARVLAGPPGPGVGQGSQRERVRDATGGSGPAVADPGGAEHQGPRHQPAQRPEPAASSSAVGDTEVLGRGRSGLGQGRPGNPPQPRGSGVVSAESGVGRDADGPAAGLDGHRWPAPPGPHQHPWEPPRTVGKGIPHRGKRVKALGNAVVPQQGALAFAVLWQRIEPSPPITLAGPRGASAQP